MNLERPERAEVRYAEALSLFEQVGDARGVADVLDARAMAAFLHGDVTASIAAFDRVARCSPTPATCFRVLTPRSTRGHALVFAGAAGDGPDDATEALDLARSLGSPEGRSYAQWQRSEALTACGSLDEATIAASDALAIAEGIGHRGWTATALRARGIAQQAGGDLAAAEASFRRRWRPASTCRCSHAGRMRDSEWCWWPLTASTTQPHMWSTPWLSGRHWATTKLAWPAVRSPSPARNPTWQN
jgi:hypothetical protein